ERPGIYLFEKAFVQAVAAALATAEETFGARAAIVALDEQVAPAAGTGRNSRPIHVIAFGAKNALGAWRGQARGGFAIRDWRLFTVRRHLSGIQFPFWKQDPAQNYRVRP